jgi:hypothetical protein
MVHLVFLAVLLPADFFAPLFLAVVLFLAGALFFPGALFFAVVLFLAAFFFGAGTFAPFSRASDKPMAIACLRLVTFLPLRPLVNVPFFLRRMALSTVFCDFFEYFAITILFIIAE